MEERGKLRCEKWERREREKEREREREREREGERERRDIEFFFCRGDIQGHTNFWSESRRTNKIFVGWRRGGGVTT